MIDGLSWQTRADTRPTPLEQATQAANLTLIVGFAGAQMALLVSAALAVGARRQRRELAMLAAVGASNRQVARVVVANGMLLGVLAAMLSPGDLSAVAGRLPLRALLPIRTVPAGPTYSPAVLQAANPEQPPPDSPRTVAVGDRELIRAATGRDPDAATLGVLRRGGAVTFYPEWDHGGTVRLLTDRGRTIRLPSTLVPAPDRYRDLPGLVIAERTAGRLGLPLSPGGMLLDTTREPTAAELAAAQATALSAQLRRGPAGWSSPVRLLVAGAPDSQTSSNPMVYILAVISVLTTVLASGVAVWLAAAEMRDDLSTLTAVGAGPRLRRWTAAAQAGLIVGVGGILGVAGGIAPAAGLVALRGDLSWHVDWCPLALTVLGAPLLAVLVTAVASRPRLVLVRRLT